MIKKLEEARNYKDKGNNESRHIERADYYLKACLKYEQAIEAEKKQAVMDYFHKFNEKTAEVKCTIVCKDGEHCKAVCPEVECKKYHPVQITMLRVIKIAQDLLPEKVK